MVSSLLGSVLQPSDGFVLSRIHDWADKVIMTAWRSRAPHHWGMPQRSHPQLTDFTTRGVPSGSKTAWKM